MFTYHFTHNSGYNLNSHYIAVYDTKTSHVYIGACEYLSYNEYASYGPSQFFMKVHSTTGAIVWNKYHPYTNYFMYSGYYEPVLAFNDYTSKLYFAMNTNSYCVILARMDSSDGTNTHRYRYCGGYVYMYEIGLIMNHQNGNIILIMSTNQGT